MAKILKSDFAEFDEIVKSLKNVVDGLVEVDKKISDTKNGLKGASLGGLVSEQEALSKIEKERLRDMKLLYDAEIKSQKLTQEKIKTEISQGRLLKQSKTDENRQLKEEIRLRNLVLNIKNAEKSSVDRLVASNKLLSFYQSKLNTTTAEGAAQYSKYANSIATNNAKINSTLLGGNGFISGMAGATKQVNNLKFSMAQLIREAPSISYGLTMFVGAISNNIGGLFDDIKRLREANKALAASGRDTIPIGKAIASALFSWQTAIILLITATIAFLPKIQESIKKNRELKNAIDDVKKSTDAYVVSLKNQGVSLKAIVEIQKSLNKVKEESIKNSDDEIIKLDLLYKTATDYNLSLESRLSAQDELSKKYPSQLKNFTDEDYLIGNVAESYKKLTKDIRAYAEMQSIVNELVETNTKIRGLEASKNKELTEQWGFFTKSWERYVSSWKTNPLGLGLFNTAESDLNARLGIVKKINENLGSLISTRDELLKRLNYVENPEGESGGKTGDNRLRNARLQNEILINKFIEEQTKKHEEKVLKIKAMTWLTEKEQEDKIKKFESIQELDLFMYKKGLNDQLLNITKLTESEILDIKKESSELQRQMTQAASEEVIDSMDRELEIEKEYYSKKQEEFKKFNNSIKKQMKDQSEDEMSNTAEQIDIAQLNAIKKAAIEFTAAKGNADKQKEIKNKLQSDLIKIELDGWKFLKGIDDENIALTIEDRKKVLEKIRELEKQYNLKILDDESETYDKRIENLQKYVDMSQDIVNAGFDFRNQLYENDAARAQRMYEIETAMATDSVEQKMIADAKYEKEKRKIAKRQAILDKAQGAFNVIVDTAQAIMSAPKDFGTAAPVVMAAYGILGGIQLATILAQPIPAYKTGTKDSEGVALMAEEGGELVKEPSGKMWVAKEKGIYDLEPHSIVYPHDETQKMLAQMAVEQTNNIIGLGETNALLRSINNNSKKSDVFWENGNFTYRKKGNIIYKSQKK